MRHPILLSLALTMFKTTCHQPPGTYTVSPGPCNKHEVPVSPTRRIRIHTHGGTRPPGQTRAGDQLGTPCSACADTLAQTSCSATKGVCLAHSRRAGQTPAWTYLMASESSPLSGLTSSRGADGGNKHHRLWPRIKVFHAAVPSGSMCMPVPVSAGSHRSAQGPTKEAM